MNDDIGYLEAVARKLREATAALKGSNDEAHRIEVERCLVLTRGEVPLKDWKGVVIDSRDDSDDDRR